MLKRDNYILLDIDDCIFPNCNLWCGQGDPKDDLIIAEINIKRLKLICEKWDLKICIISSMASSFILKEDGVYYNMEGYVYDPEVEIANLLRKYLSDYIKDISSGNKRRDIHNYIDKKEVDKILVIEDSDFSDIIDKYNNVHWINTKGFLTGGLIYKIKNIIEESTE